MHTILLVEDTHDVLENLTEILVMEGYQVMTATNGFDALDIVTATLPDLIITDLRMPKMDGFSFISALKEHPGRSNIPVLVFSANATPENEVRCMAMGVQGFIKKPASMELLLDAVQKILE